MPDGPEASFTSSDSQLDAVWDLCARSALYTTHEQFVDTPTREKGQFLWDACSESQVIMRVHAESNLAPGPEGFRQIPEALLARRAGERHLPDGVRSSELRELHGPISRVGLALLPEHRRCGGNSVVVPGPRTPF